MLIKFFTITLHSEKQYGSSYPYIGFSGSGLASPSLYESFESHNIKISAMDKQGFIKLSRNFIDWEWFTNAKTTQLYVFLLLAANPNPKRWRGNVLQKGQLVTTIETIELFTGLSTKEVRTALSHLKSTGYIKTDLLLGRTLITVCDFDQYCD